MSFQKTEVIELGELQVSNDKATVFVINHIGTGLAVLLFDPDNAIAGVAYVALPESSLGDGTISELPAKYVDLGVPALIEAFTQTGGNLSSTIARVVGGAQLFNFGGGGGNMLNIGSRNHIAVQTALSRYNLTIAREMTGGNKAYSITYIVASGQGVVELIGDDAKHQI